MFGGGHGTNTTSPARSVRDTELISSARVHKSFESNLNFVLYVENLNKTIIVFEYVTSK